jgi:hypothetical protein
MYVDRANGISFRSLDLTSVELVRNAVKVSGIGMMNGMRAPFTAIATDHKLSSGDWFTIGWNHAASHGGKVTSGNIRITPVETS